MRLTKQLLFSTTFALFVLVGCPSGSDKNKAGEEVPPSGLAGTNHNGKSDQNHPPLTQEQMVAEAQRNRPVVVGRVVEAIYKDAYSYVRIEAEDEKSIWVAIVNNKPAIGQTIKVQEQAILKDFHSKSLNRQFDQIVFGSVIE